MQQLRIPIARQSTTHQPGAKKQRAITEGDIKAMMKSKMRRLQEGSDADGTTVASFHP